MLLRDGLGAEVAPGLFEAELNYLHQHEWARTADDVLWRRSKLGLHMSEAERAAVARWCASNWEPIAAQTAGAAKAHSEMTWN
jgi:glycerol-3-phosphate dehydrogenase